VIGRSDAVTAIEDFRAQFWCCSCVVVVGSTHMVRVRSFESKYRDRTEEIGDDKKDSSFQDVVLGCNGTIPSVANVW
jgi:hypothetical protein